MRLHLLSQQEEELNEVLKILKPSTYKCTTDEFSISSDSIILLLTGKSDCVDNLIFLQYKVEYYAQHTLVVVVMNQSSSYSFEFQYFISNQSCISFQSETFLKELKLFLQKQEWNTIFENEDELFENVEFHEEGVLLDESYQPIPEEKPQEEEDLKQESTLLFEEEEEEEISMSDLSNSNLSDELKNDILMILGDNWRPLEKYKKEIKKYLERKDFNIKMDKLNKEKEFQHLKPHFDLILEILINMEPSNEIKRNLRVSKYSSATYSEYGDILCSKNSIVLFKLNPFSSLEN
jgi:hypothetical protein